MVKDIIGFGSITLTDLNDASISMSPPKNPETGDIWIDSSGTKNILKQFDGTEWVNASLDVTQLDEDLSQKIITIENTLGNIGDDGKLTYDDRKILIEELNLIVGETISTSMVNNYKTALPDYTLVDSNASGSFANYRLAARDVGIKSTNPKYRGLQEAYTTMISFLARQGNPKPWDIRKSNKTEVTTLTDADEFRKVILDYYLAELALVTVTSERAQEMATSDTIVEMSGVTPLVVLPTQEGGSLQVELQGYYKAEPTTPEDYAIEIRTQQGKETSEGVVGEGTASHVLIPLPKVILEDEALILDEKGIWKIRTPLEDIVLSKKAQIGLNNIKSYSKFTILSMADSLNENLNILVNVTARSASWYREQKAKDYTDSSVSNSGSALNVEVSGAVEIPEISVARLTRYTLEALVYWKGGAGSGVIGRNSPMMNWGIESVEFIPEKSENAPEDAPERDPETRGVISYEPTSSIDVNTRNLVKTNFVPMNKWSSLTVTYDGSRTTIYIDGKKAIDRTTGAPLNLKDLEIGLGKNGSLFDGYISNIRMWDRALSAEDVKRYQKRQLRGDEPGLVIYYRLNGGNVITDSGPHENHIEPETTIGWVDDTTILKELDDEIEVVSTKVTQLADSWALNIHSNDQLVLAINASTEGLKIRADMISINLGTPIDGDRTGKRADVGSLLEDLDQRATKEELEAIELTPGPEGKTAYEIAWDNGYRGSETEWIDSLIGKKGDSGKTAYQVAVDNGFQGTPNEWLNSLKGSKGEDAYTVILSNESHTFEGGVTSPIAGRTTQVEVIAYKGASTVTPSIGTLSGDTAGISSSISGKTITFTTTGSTKLNGIVNIPITINGISFTRTFSYTVALKGKDGSKGDAGSPGTDGEDGADGRGITSTTIEYQNHTSGTAPGSNWRPTSPGPKEGEYLWTRTTIVYTDGTNSVGYSTSYTPLEGDGVTGSTVTYAVGSSGTTPPGGWDTNIPPLTDGNYLWTKTVTTYKKREAVTTYSISYISKDGEKGDTGDAGTPGRPGTDAQIIKLTPSAQIFSKPKGSNSYTPTTITIAASRQNITGGTWTYSTNGGGFVTTVPTFVTRSGDTVTINQSGIPASLRTLAVKLKSGNTEDVTTIGIVADGDKGDKGEPGQRGIQGPTGDNGQSQWIHLAYSAYADGTGFEPEPQSNSLYMGVANTNSPTPPTTKGGYRWSLIKGEPGTRGPQGLPGSSGKDGTDGVTTYTWIKYANSKTPSAGEMNDHPDGMKYIGLSFNQTDENESTRHQDYEWSLMPQNIKYGGVNLYRNSMFIKEDFEHWHVESGVSRVEGGALIESSFGRADAIQSTIELEPGNYKLQIWYELLEGQTPYFFWTRGANGSILEGDYSIDPEGNYQEFTLAVHSKSLSPAIRYASGSPVDHLEGKFLINKIKLERGDIASDYQEAPEDTDEKIKDTADEAFVGATEFALGESERVAEHAEKQTDLLREAYELDKERKDQDLAQLSGDIKTTAAEFKASFNVSGGVNEIRNSVGYASTEEWDSTGSITTTQNAELETYGSGSAFILSSNSSIEQEVLGRAGDRFLSVIVQKNSSSRGEVRVTSDGLNKVYPIPAGEEMFFVRIDLPFSIVGTHYKLKLSTFANSEILFTSVMVNYGAERQSWGLAYDEIYGSTFRMNRNGFRVYHQDSTQYTSMTPTEFAGHALVGGVWERTFAVNGEVTEMRIADVKEQLNIGKVQQVYIDSRDARGLAVLRGD